MGRPSKATPADWEDIVAAQWMKHHSNTIYLETIINLEQKQKTPNTAHKNMLTKGYMSEQQSKQKRHKLRYEQTHTLALSFLAVHMDWHVNKPFQACRYAS
jgi:hypothetical protein